MFLLGGVIRLKEVGLRFFLVRGLRVLWFVLLFLICSFVKEFELFLWIELFVIEFGFVWDDVIDCCEWYEFFCCEVVENDIVCLFLVMCIFFLVVKFLNLFSVEVVLLFVVVLFFLVKLVCYFSWKW